MKKMMLVLSLVVMSVTASAGYVDYLKSLTFAELAENYDVDFENDQVWFGGKIVSILNTCMSDAETVRTLNKVTIDEMDGDDFVVVGKDYLYKSIYGTKVVVDGDDTVDVPYTMNTTRTIRIVEMGDDFDGDLLFKRDFTIPACK